MAFEQTKIDNWVEQYPLLREVVQLKPVSWLNPNAKKMADAPKLPVTLEDMNQAEQLWKRFAPFIANAFPETGERDGIIESVVRPIPGMKKELNSLFGAGIKGSLYLKCDNELPIAGSVKARGGIYEVLQHAEQLALNEGLVKKDDNYQLFASEAFRQFFGGYSIGVGSTGNLGLSIGILGAKLGFKTTVFMSEDAKQWKKDLLRANGAVVKECAGDFSEACARGREETKLNPNAYFVDDEKSKHLFLGYSVAALRLKNQLEQEGVQVDMDHPLFVYLPCGVGGAPGGIAFGLKQIYGDAVHCFFAEPTHSPAVLIGLMTGEKERIAVQDLGIDNLTEADGLAVGRPSSFASSISEHLVSGVYTLEDDDLFRLLALLADSEGIFVEPSATAGFLGPGRVRNTDYVKKHGLDMANAAHLVWATGGALVPDEDRHRFYAKGKKLLASLT